MSNCFFKVLQQRLAPSTHILDASIFWRALVIMAVPWCRVSLTSSYTGEQRSRTLSSQARSFGYGSRSSSLLGPCRVAGKVSGWECASYLYRNAACNSNPRDTHSHHTSACLGGGAEELRHVDLGGELQIGDTDVIARDVVRVLEPDVIDPLGVFGTDGDVRGGQTQANLCSHTTTSRHRAPEASRGAWEATVSPRCVRRPWRPGRGPGCG